MSPEKIREILNIDGLDNFEQLLKENGHDNYSASDINILQINVGKKCNLACKHCHVDAGSAKEEMMSKDVFEECLKVAALPSVDTIDITGGAPEMNNHLEWFISQVSLLNKRLIVRSNLVILEDPVYSHFIDLYVDKNVEVVTSLPAVDSQKSDRQRGRDTFNKIINVMKKLNEKGYSKKDTGLIIDIVHNPVGAILPGNQCAMERMYKEELRNKYGVEFNKLFVITNCPVGRYLDYLVKTDNVEDYMYELRNAFNSNAAESAMCRVTLSVSWDGRLYDCDFNQMIGLTVKEGVPYTIKEFNYDLLKNRRITLGNHCYCCTAGSGSSCQGATA